MGQVLHGCATRTEAVSVERSSGVTRAEGLAWRYGINQKKVAKWKKRETIVDVPAGPKEPHPSVLPVDEEAIIVAFRLHAHAASAG